MLLMNPAIDRFNWPSSPGLDLSASGDNFWKIPRGTGVGDRSGLTAAFSRSPRESLRFCLVLRQGETEGCSWRCRGGKRGTEKSWRGRERERRREKDIAKERKKKERGGVQIDTQKDIQVNKQADRHTSRKTDRHIDTLNYSLAFLLWICSYTLH